MKEPSAHNLRARDAPGPEPAEGQTYGVPVTRQQIAEYLESLRAQGRVEESVKKYGRDLAMLYDFLTDGKEIDRTTLARWREELLARGYAPRTVNAAISEANSFLGWLGRREYQLPRQLEIAGGAQPVLTRAEYLRLLSTAREMGKERTYLMVKVFAVTGIGVQELPRLTVEAVREGRLEVNSGGRRQFISIPASLRDDLTRYIHRTGLTGGPVFVSRNGKEIWRTTVTGEIQGIAHNAGVPPEKCNPRCLRKLYLTTMAGIEASVHPLVEQTYERLLEQEQLTVGWGEVHEP